MMKFNQENDHWQKLQHESNSIKQRLQILRMIFLLLKKANLTESEIAGYDCDELTKLFEEYREAGGQIADFFKRAIPHLDPEYKGEAYETQLLRLREQITETIAESGRVLDQLTQWQAEEKHLHTENARLESIKAEADILERNLILLKEYHDRLVPNIRRFEQLSSSGENLYAEIQQCLTDSIPRMIELIRENYEIHKAHFHENDQIRDAFAKIGNLPDIAENIFEINKLSQNISELFHRFDQILGRLIRIRENDQKLARSQREVR